MRNNFSEDYQQFGPAPSKIFDSPLLGRKGLKNVIKNVKFLVCPERPHVSGWSW